MQNINTVTPEFRGTNFQPNTVAESESVNIHNSVIASDLTKLQDGLNECVQVINNPTFQEIDDTIQAIQNDINGHQNDINIIQNDISRINNDVNGHQNDITGLQNNISLHSNQINGLINEVQSDIGGINNNITGLQGDISEIQDDINGHQTDINGIQANISGINNNITGLQGDIGEIQDDISGIQDDITGLQGDISEIQDDITDLWNGIGDSTGEGIISGAKTARFVIGTSTAGWKSKDCDYLCDGTADQTEINAAITALPATGGEIVILDGTYNITAKIDVTKDNVSIRGNGNATILKRMFNSSTPEGVITLTGRSGCKIANLQIEGNRTSYNNSSNIGIHLNSSSENNIVTSNTCNNNEFGIYLHSSNNNTITGNTCYNNNSSGISLNSSSNNSTVTGNTCNDNNERGISLNGASRTNITGNTCYNNNSSGIRLSNSSNNTVTGNTCIRGTGLEKNYISSQHTIQLSGTGNIYNLIAMNNCMGKAVTNGGGTGNTLVNNKFDAS